jgi:hypothetical protein
MTIEAKSFHPRRTRTLLLVAAITTLMASLLIFFAWSLYPVSDGDASFFMPAAQWYQRNGRLFNKLVGLAYDTDQAGEGRFLYYQPAFTLLIGKLASLSGNESYRGVYLWVAILRAAGVFLFSIVIYKILVINIKIRRYWLLVLTGVMLVASQALYLLPANGRGETLTMTLVTAGMVVEFSKFAHRRWIMSIVVSLIFSISIANGAIALWVYAVYLAFAERSFQARIAWIIGTFFLAVALFYLSYILAGIDFSEGMEGLRRHAKIQIGRTDTSLPLLLSYWKSWLIFGVLAAFQLSASFRKSSFLTQSSPQDRFYLVVSLLFLSLSVYIFALRTAPSHYSIYAFLPLLQALSLCFLAESLPRHSIKSFAAVAIISMAILLSLVIPLQALIAYPYYAQSGKSYEDALQRLSSLKSAWKCPLVYSNGLFVLDPNLEGSIYQIDSDGFATSERAIREDAIQGKSNCRLILVQEVNSDSDTPPKARMVMDFSDQSAQLGFLRRLRLLKSPKGYSFKAYVQPSMER